MSGIKISFVDKDYKGKFKSWGLRQNVSLEDVGNRDREVVISNLKEKCKLPWRIFLHQLEELCITELLIIESDPSIYPETYYVDDLPVAFKITEDNEGITLHAEVNCDYLEEIVCKVKVEASND